MKIACPKCKREYRLDPSRIPAKGARFTCWGCQAKVEVRPMQDGQAEATIEDASKTEAREVATASVATKSEPPVKAEVPTPKPAPAKEGVKIEPLRIKCPKCQNEYRIDPSRVPAGGGKFTCRNCQARIEVRPAGKKDISEILGATAPLPPEVAPPEPAPEARSKSPFDGESTMIMGSPVKAARPAPSVEAPKSTPAPWESASTPAAPNNLVSKTSQPEPPSAPPIFDPFATSPVEAVKAPPKMESEPLKDKSFAFDTTKPEPEKPAPFSFDFQAPVAPAEPPPSLFTPVEASPKSAGEVKLESASTLKMEAPAPKTDTKIEKKEDLAASLSNLTRSSSQTSKLGSQTIPEPGTFNDIFKGDPAVTMPPSAGGTKTTKLDSQSFQDLFAEAKKEEKPEALPKPSVSKTEPFAAKPPAETPKMPAKTEPTPPVSIGKPEKPKSPPVKEPDLPKAEEEMATPKIVYHGSMEEEQKRKSKARLAVYGGLLGLLAAGLVIGGYLYLYPSEPEPPRPRLTQNIPSKEPPDTKPEPKSDAKPDTKPETPDKLDTKPEPKLDTKPDTKPETPDKLDTKPEPKLDTKPPKPEPKPEPVKPVTPPSGGKFSVQAGASPSEAEANALSSRLQKMGFSAYVVRADLGAKGVWYRVRTGSFDSESEARKTMSDLKAKGIDCFIARN